MREMRFGDGVVRPATIRSERIRWTFEPEPWPMWKRARFYWPTVGKPGRRRWARRALENTLRDFQPRRR